MKPNFENRTLFHGDNLDFLRAMNSNTIDLIATDPPFNKGRDFHATPESLAKGAQFQDRWNWEDDVHSSWVDQIRDDWPHVWRVIENSRQTYGDDMAAFLCFMAVRLIEVRRVLKDTGSIYLHCDPTASHYLKMLLDGVFNKDNFRNEIVWYYKNASRGKHNLAKSHDLIFWYSKSKQFTFNRDKILAPFESGMTEWRYERGGQKGKTQPKGKTPDDVIIMPSLNAMAKERTGYPTQKPLMLYERIIEASSKQGDVVLDPFCGCATTLIAAEKLKRQWVGIDIWKGTRDIVLQRLKNEGLSINGSNESKLITSGDVFYLTTPPERTDSGHTAAPYLRPKYLTLEPPPDPPDGLTNIERKRVLIQKFGIVCQGCDRKFAHPQYLELDHNVPRSEGGSNNIINRLLLCSPCNRRKSNQLTLSGLRNKNKRERFMADQEAKTGQLWQEL